MTSGGGRGAKPPPSFITVLQYLIHLFRYRNGAPVVKNAKRSGLPSQCIRCGDLQRQDAISRKYDEQSGSYSKGQGYIDLLSDSDDEAPKSESAVSATAESSTAHSLAEAYDGGAAEEAGDSGGPGASSSCGLLCVPLTDVHLGKGAFALCHSLCFPMSRHTCCQSSAASLSSALTVHRADFLPKRWTLSRSLLLLVRCGVLLS
jgi:hypothetical protein